MYVKFWAEKLGLVEKGCPSSTNYGKGNSSPNPPDDVIPLYTVKAVCVFLDGVHFIVENGPNIDVAELSYHQSPKLRSTPHS